MCRAGRYRTAGPIRAFNSMLKARVFTALVLLAVFLLALWWLPAWGWAAFVALVIGAAAWEWGGLGGFPATPRVFYAAFSAGVTLAVGVWLPTAAAVSHDLFVLKLVFAGATVFWLLIVPLWLIRKWRLAPAPLAAAVGWAVLIPAACALMQLRALDPAIVLAAMAAVWVADIAAYFAGRAFGRHKLAPQISPGKTWEGVAGALLGVSVYGLGMIAATGKNPWLTFYGALAGLALLTAVSVIGDLFESLLKRQAGMKDSGSLLPGHGGVLDRIDSLTSTLPLIGLIFIFNSKL